MFIIDVVVRGAARGRAHLYKQTSRVKFGTLYFSTYGIKLSEPYTDSYFILSLLTPVFTNLTLRAQNIIKPIHK